MKLILEKHKGGWEAFCDTRYGRLSARDVLRAKVRAYKTGRWTRKPGVMSYTDLLIEADVEHSQYYNYVSGNCGFTVSMLNLFIALGCDIVIRKPAE